MGLTQDEKGMKKKKVFNHTNTEDIGSPLRVESS